MNICRYRHKTGKTLYIKSRAKVTQWSKDGKPLFVEGIHMDVTTEHEAHRELERLRLILEQTNRTAKVGGWQYTPDTNEMIWTKTTYDIHEIDIENSPTIDITSAISFYKEGSSRERIEEIFKLALAGPFSYNEELQIITSKGNERWIRAQGISEFKNGKCVRMYGSFQDIHENKIADLRLKTEEAKFRELYESSPVAICKNCFKTGRFLDINHAAHLLLGYSIDELRSRDYQDITPEEYADADKIQNEILVSRGRFGPFEKEYFRKDGSRCEVQVTGFYVESEDGEPITWALIQDIGERKKTERSMLEAMKAAEKANYAKSAFLAAMSHEIRTPLNGIIGSTELLSETDIDESQQALIQMILNSGDVLLSTISDVLDYSKIEAGQMQLEESPFAPLDVAEQVLDIMTPKARAAGIEMGVTLGTNCPEMLSGDAVRIRQILINFVGNAVKFTHEGSVEVGIDYQEPEGLKLSVRDTGIGICEEKIKEIFKPFTQADLSTTRKYGGSGLGLAICKSLANLMGGKIQIESVEGEGSIFSLSIPLKPIESPKIIQSP
ncbi:MAG: ATP-binding protein, partial [Verrucomicrobiota bacterium]